VLVKETCRRGGVGTALLQAALGWFKERGIKDVYLESGLNNHAAHEYFMRRGFVKVSEIYKLM
jgi:ribosomal protein S18 acetylase RimI-like enzyme